MTEGLTTTFAIKIGGKALSAQEAELVRRGTVERSWSAADRAVVEFRTPEFEFPGSVGADLQINLVDKGKPTTEPLFEGTITGVGLRYGGDGQARLRVEALDRRHVLTRKITPKTYQNRKLDDLVKQIASDNGLSASSNLGTTKFEHFLVADSHFAVLQQIARRTGTVWTLDGTTITFTEPKVAGGAVKAEAGKELIDIDLRFAPVEQANQVKVNGWNQAQGTVLNGSSTTTQVQKNHIKEKPTATARSWSGGAVSVDDANTIAAGIGRRLRASEVVGWGMMTATEKLKPGGSIVIEGIGDQFSGDYVVSAVTHRLGDLDESATTEFRIGAPDSSLDQLLGGDARIGGQAPPGLTIGIVENTKDPDRLGRIRVKLPLISDELVTGWIRTASIGSGPDRGIVFVPEINDEVIVAFEHGELNRPYVLGTLWNQPGTAFDGAVKESVTDERRLVSKLGHRLRFIDIKDSDATSGISIEIDHTSQGTATARVFLGYKELTIETERRPLTIKNGKASILLDKDDITLTANNIKINATQNVEVSSKADTTVKASANVKLEATAKLEAKGTAGATVESPAITTIKGSMVQVN